MATNYSIVSQKQGIEINPATSSFDAVWEITYRVTAGPAKGTVATVSVPEDSHNASEVQAAIEAKISDLESIAKLGSSGNA